FIPSRALRSPERYRMPFEDPPIVCSSCRWIFTIASGRTMTDGTLEKRSTPERVSGSKAATRNSFARSGERTDRSSARSMVKALPVRVSLEGVPPGEGRVGLQHGRVHRARRMCHRVQAYREGRDPLELPSRLLRCRVPIRLTRCARGLRLISGVDDKMGVMLAERKPEWLRVRPPAGENYGRLKSLVRSLDLHTVCEEAHCP